MSELVALAERFVRLSGELDATRDAMRRLLLNGAGDKPDTPFAKPVRSKPGGSKQKHPHAIAAAAAEGKIIEVLRSTPGMKTTEIARATGSRTNTVSQRLARMRDRGAITGGGPRGLSRQRLTPEEVADLIAPGPPLASEPWVRSISLYQREATLNASILRFG